MILTSAQPEFFEILRQLEGIPLCAVNNDFAQALGDVEIKAESLNNFVTNPDPAYRYASQVIAKAHNPFSANGLKGEVLDFMRVNLPTFLYPRLANLAMLTLALDEAQPKLILLHNDVEPANRVMALWAKVNDVPCLHIPHAIYQDVNRTKPGTDVHDMITASHLAVSGPFQAKWYQKRGVKPESIRVTGLPQFDKMLTSTMSPSRARRLLKLDPARPVVVYASTWPQHTNLLGATNEWEVNYRAFLEATKTLPGVQVVVKGHPRAGQDNAQWHIEQAKAQDVDCIFTMTHLDVCLFAADAILAYGGSNILLEAALTPYARLLTTHGYHDDLEIIKIKPATPSIAAGLQKALGAPRPALGNFIAKYLGPSDGKSSERIAAWVKELYG